MAPKRGSKRATTAAASSPAKARKVEQPYIKYGVSNTQFSAIKDAIDMADHLGEDCREMLTAMAPHSICVASDERGEQQAMVVDMLDDVLKAVVGKLEAAVADSEAAIAEVDAARADAEAKVTSTKYSATAAEAAAEAAKASLATRTGEVAEAKKALAAKQEEQKTGDARSAAADTEKAIFEGCLANEFKALKDTTWDKPAECKKLYTAADKVIKKLALEESMLAALPSTLQRKAAERGSFDQMLLEQCEKQIQSKADELAAEIAAAAPAAAERAAHVEAAQGQLMAAQSAQESAAADLTSAQAALKAAKAEAQVAEQEFAKSEPAKQKAVIASSEKKAELENFTTFNVETFNLLKSRTAKKEEPEPVAEEAKEVEAAPEAAPEVAA